MTKLNPDDDLKNWHLYKTDPPQYLALCNEIVRQHPNNPDVYVGRHTAWMRVGQFDKALEDLNKAINLNPDGLLFGARGQLLYQMGRIDDAIKDLDKADELNPMEWEEAFSPVYRAQCHAQLGNLEAALKDCRRINPQHWTPGVHGMLKGDRTEITAQIMRIALDAANRKNASGS